MGGLFQPKEATAEDASSDEEVDEPVAAVNSKDAPSTQTTMDTDDNPF